MNELHNAYEQFHELRLKNSLFGYNQLQNLVEEISRNSQFEVNKEGLSTENRSIYSLSIGQGPVKILAWTQMHGNEPTATMALMDLVKFFNNPGQFTELRDLILQNCSLKLIPMLNPDGVVHWTRETALGIDMNRDALQLNTPEGLILKAIQNSWNPDFGFNLHDQDRVHGVGNTGIPALMSFLAPAFNMEKEINSKRAESMSVIGKLFTSMQSIIPNQIGRYPDDFEPRAFGDNITAWGTRVILIESGNEIDNREKPQVRKLNFIALIKAFEIIAKKMYSEHELDTYNSIPFNKRNMCDLKLEGLSGRNFNRPFDISINQTESFLSSSRQIKLRGKIEAVGDLSSQFGYRKINVGSLEIKNAFKLEKTVSREELENINFLDLIKSGILYIKIDFDTQPEDFFPINTYKNSIIHELVSPEKPANFLLFEGSILRYAIINGFLVDLDEPTPLTGVYGWNFN